MASGKRSDKLKRLVAVQRHLEKMAEGELADTSRHRQEITDSMATVMEAISSDNPVHRLFAKDYADRFGRMMIREQQLAGLQQIQEMKVMRERTKAERLEDNMKDARVLEEREAEDNAIYDLLDQTVAAAQSASSKLHKR